jgi:hypothetical protein
MFFPHLLSSHHKSTQPCLRHCFRLHGRVEPGIPARWRWGKLGGLSSGQVCGSCTTLSFNFAIFCSVIFFRPPGHYVTDITLFNWNISSVLSYCYYACDLNILNTCIEASVLLFRTGVWQAVSCKLITMKKHKVVLLKQLSTVDSIINICLYANWSDKYIDDRF